MFSILACVAVWWLAAACRATPQNREEIASEIDRVLSEEYPANLPGAVILVASEGEILLERGYGLSDLESESPVTPETVFRIASITKLFTTTAVLQLVDRGEISLSASVSDYLTDIVTLDTAITIDHLLAHTSGLPELLDRPDFMDWVARERTVDELLESFVNRAPTFAPGDLNRYSNSNYILLGFIIERATGQSLAGFLGTNIFEPLGMNNTACNTLPDSLPMLATPYEPLRTADGDLDWDHFVVGRPYTMSSLYAAGGCVSSVRDLNTFNQALFDGRLLRAETLERSLDAVRLNDGNTSNGSNGGWQIDRIGGRTAFMKGGSMPGTCTWYLTIPEKELMVVLLSNRTPGQPRCGMLTVKLTEIALRR